MTAITTEGNPGSHTPYLFKSPRSIASSFLTKVKKGELMMALRFMISESANLAFKSQITTNSGKYYCPICGSRAASFVHLSNSLRFTMNSSCGHCSSRARHRGLYYLYSDLKEELTEEKRVLHFAPEPVFYSLFKDQRFVYQTSDYLLKDVDLPAQDIQQLTIDAASYDVVLCNHVIEHVPDDVKSLQEIKRILKPNGKVLLTIPGDFTRKKTRNFDHLANNGHYRDYGRDFIEVFSSIFPQYSIVDLYDYQKGQNLAIPKDELVFIGIKEA